MSLDSLATSRPTLLAMSRTRSLGSSPAAAISAKWKGTYLSGWRRAATAARGHHGIRRENGTFDEGDADVLPRFEQMLHRLKRGLAVRAAVIEELGNRHFGVRRARYIGDLGIEKRGRADLRQRVIADLVVGGGFLRSIELVRHLRHQFGMAEKIIVHHALDAGFIEASQSGKARPPPMTSPARRRRRTPLRNPSISRLF